MRGYIQVYTGNGKGKTTASLGLILRALGNDLKVYVGQFMKGQRYGELNTLEKLGVLVERFGTEECLMSRDDVSELDIKKAKEGYKRVLEIILSKKYDLVILDEICVSTYFNLITEEEILHLMKVKPLETELVLTGRYAPEKVIEQADLVTEMKEIKHYYEQGVMARDGIER
ncbi:cob(I)yrinic acid a,c-diamide adenosyltransferase [Ilyobacter polytropus]|uniref:Cob(I)yrinic acid a,c-diamide adenosyltransferase n=1 Tax=Ilyobacter polytropus (strain ATCC 51220 / DSM 2926 / LMG 16218 / CuHBu1) TaxID=572544 RepID=E3H8V7_ILYPC|nr:cob(I)yrinic acid a,c-diamide adenosyltransferase [Ilyobacter polytropus]ADO83371.1 cob(I)yrinic acid a,c-diamide adenosyltransferase [Ilyobacter polytropus DSM 2926]